LSHQVEFAGYNVWVSETPRYGDYQRFAAYDRENYVKHFFLSGIWTVMDDPFTLEELRCLYAVSCDDSTWQPETYTESSPLQVLDTLIFFEPYGANLSEFGVETPIRKRFPSALPHELTEDGYPKIYEYEIEIPVTSPACRYVAVTATDHGQVVTWIPQMESDRRGLGEQICAYPAICCIGSRGNVNYDLEDECNLVDLTYLVAFMFREGPSPACMEEADFNGSGMIDVVDLTALVQYLFADGAPPSNCP